jgi:hypothetical protein
MMITRTYTYKVIREVRHLKTQCDFVGDCKVGSAACTRHCKSFLGHNEEFQIVYCHERTKV